MSKIRQKTVDKRVFLFWEVNTAIYLIIKGIEEAEKEPLTSEKFIIPLQLISNGFERFLKCLICLGKIGENWEFTEPPYKIKKGKGHDLTYLLKELVTLLPDETKFPNLKIDARINSILDNEYLGDILGYLSHFGQIGRYSFLDYVIGKRNEPVISADPWRAWKLMIDIMDKKADKEFESQGKATFWEGAE